MISNHVFDPALADPTPTVRPGTYSPITVHMGDTLGVLFLGVLSCILLAGWVRAEARLRALSVKFNESRQSA